MVFVGTGCCLQGVASFVHLCCHCEAVVVLCWVAVVVLGQLGGFIVGVVVVH